jgi:hypothetical protein
MVFDMHGQPLHRRIEARPLGHGPTFEDAFEFQAEIIMEMAGRMLLNDK